MTVYNIYFGRDTKPLPSTFTFGIELNGENDELAFTPQIRKGLSKSGALAGAFGVRLPINKRDEQGVKWVDICCGSTWNRCCHGADARAQASAPRAGAGEARLAAGTDRRCRDHERSRRRSQSASRSIRGICGQSVPDDSIVVDAGRPPEQRCRHDSRHESSTAS